MVVSNFNTRCVTAYPLCCIFVGEPYSCHCCTAHHRTAITPNDGHVNLYWMPSEYLATRLDVYKFGVKLNKGMGLVDVPGVEGVRVQEFALDIVANDGDAGATARSSKVNMAPLNIDGEAMPQSSVRVKVLPRALTFYAQDDRASPDAAVSDG
eukprot:m.1204603 g.1204603  ORF g.1204603 m.1204603 type:complete len:153 (+) comp24581_c0_seq1:340-798(+)